MKPLKTTTWLMLNWLGFAGVIAVNSLANILPINGYNTGEISAMYPNLFVPAGFTFGIWGIIYLALLDFCLAATFFLFSKKTPEHIVQSLHTILPYFFISSLLNMAWILAWHHLLIVVSLIIMICFLGVLLRLFVKLPPIAGKLTLAQQVILATPFSIYLAWICVATIANTTAVLVHFNLVPLGLAPWLWSCIMIGAAVGIAILLTLFYSRISVGLVVMWALYGVYMGQKNNNETIGKVALAGIIAVAIVVLATGFRAVQAFRTTSR